MRARTAGYLSPLDPDTALGGAAGAFPRTQRSLLAALRAGDERERQDARSTLVEVYWKPVYKYIRLKWRIANEPAKDLTQGFFTRVFEKDYFAAYDPAKAAFRTYLRTCLDAYLANEHKAQGRLKRGGGVAALSLDFAAAEDELSRLEPAAPDDAEQCFRAEWVRSLFESALARLRCELAASGRAAHLRLFERYDLEDAVARGKLTYDDLAREFGLPVTQVTNFLGVARREFRRIALERLREVSGSDEEYRLEARALFGVNET